MRYLIFFLPLFLISCGGEKTKSALPEDLDSLLVYHATRFENDTNNQEYKKLYVDVLIQHGNKMLKELDFSKALNDGAKAFRLDSTQIEARMLFADILNNTPDRTMDEIASAQRHYGYIVKKQAKNTKALVGLASTYSQQMDFDQSFNYINQALRINSRYRDAYVLKGSNYLFLGKIDLAKSSYETAVQQDPEFFEAYLMLGSLYQAEKNAICIEYYTTAAELQPKNPDVLYALAYAKQVFGKVDEALPIYRNMIQIDTTYYIALFQIGHIKQFNIGELDSAIYYYKSALQTEPRFVEAWHNLGLCYEDLGDKTRALQSYAKALKHNPDFELSRKQADALR
jgi:tetratricopeptide (TPR) repeat protein